MNRGSRGLHLDYEALYRRYQDGESTVEIARSIGIDQSGLNRAWRRRGYVLRTISEAKLLDHERHPELRESIRKAQATRRGSTDTEATKLARAVTRQQRGIGISANERILAEALTARGVATRAQVAFGPYSADLTIDAHRLVIEVDGGGHSERNRSRRAQRTAFIEAQGYRIVHVWAKRSARDWLARALAKIEAHL